MRTCGFVEHSPKAHRPCCGTRVAQLLSGARTIRSANASAKGPAGEQPLELPRLDAVRALRLPLEPLEASRA